MPFCPNCGNNVRPDFSFCPSCGAKLPHDDIGNNAEKGRLRIESSKVSGLMASYEGYLKDGIPEGKGIALYDNGNTYDGEWHEGVKHGQGIFTWPDGRKFEGSFKNDYLCGHGIMCFPGGKRYEGEFLNDQMNGHGIMILSNSDRYVGEWTDGIPSGHFRFYFSDGYFLEGDRFRFFGDEEPMFLGVNHDSLGRNLYFQGVASSCISPKDCWSFSTRPDGRIYYNSRFEVPVNVIVKWHDGFYIQDPLKVFLNARSSSEFYERAKESCWSGEHVTIFECKLASYFVPQKLFVIVRTSRNDNVEPVIIDNRIYGTWEDAASVLKQSSGIDLSWQDHYYDSNRDIYWQIMCFGIEDFPEM